MVHCATGTLSGQRNELAICSLLIALSAARWAQVMVHFHYSTASAPTAFPSRVGPDLAHASLQSADV
jgi:hypothetical protein